VRRATRQLTQQTLPDLVVLSHTEVAPGTNVQSESVVTLEHEIAA
jgi:flagellar biosynthesis component FlhA